MSRLTRSSNASDGPGDDQDPPGPLGRHAYGPGYVDVRRRVVRHVGRTCVGTATSGTVASAGSTSGTDGSGTGAVRHGPILLPAGAMPPPHPPRTRRASAMPRHRSGTRSRQLRPALGERAEQRRRAIGDARRPGSPAAGRPTGSSAAIAAMFLTPISTTMVAPTAASAFQSTVEPGSPGGTWPDTTVNAWTTPRCVTGIPAEPGHGHRARDPGHDLDRSARPRRRPAPPPCPGRTRTGHRP